MSVVAAVGLGAFIARGPSTGETIGATSTALAIAALPALWMRFVGARRLRSAENMLIDQRAFSRHATRLVDTGGSGGGG